MIPHIKKDRRLSKVETLTLAKNYITALTNVIVQIRSDGGKDRPIPKAALKVLPPEDTHQSSHCQNCTCFCSASMSSSVTNSTWSTASSPNVAVLGEVCAGAGGERDKERVEDVAVQLVADVATSSKDIQKMIEGAIPVDFDRNGYDAFDESSMYG